ncbi:MAG: hypothetical protein JST31_12160 [Actinobacteria bacterium]|nr:hypothetical protein [Actinomycetota bacterium]
MATITSTTTEKPAPRANQARNARAEIDRHRRWAPARAALWGLLDRQLPAGARVAVLGAGNGDDLPLRQLAGRASSLTLIDLDRQALRAARRRAGWRRRRRVRVVEHEVTGGAADRIAMAALAGEEPSPPLVPEGPLPGAPYDLVVGDLLYSQLLYPALLDLGLEEARREAVLQRRGLALTGAVVARLHASAPLVLHLHDPLAWWPGHDQPADLGSILRLADGGDVAAALAEVDRGAGPWESDPRAAFAELGIDPITTAFWRWPFAAGVDYLVCATLATGSELP